MYDVLPRRSCRRLPLLTCKQLTFLTFCSSAITNPHRVMTPLNPCPWPQVTPARLRQFKFWQCACTATFPKNATTVVCFVFRTCFGLQMSRMWRHGGAGRYRPVVLNRGARLPGNASLNFKGARALMRSTAWKVWYKYICSWNWVKVRKSGGAWNKGYLLQGGVAEKRLRTTGKDCHCQGAVHESICCFGITQSRPFFLSTQKTFDRLFSSNIVTATLFVLFSLFVLITYHVYLKRIHGLRARTNDVVLCDWVVLATVLPSEKIQTYSRSHVCLCVSRRACRFTPEKSALSCSDKPAPVFSLDFLHCKTSFSVTPCVRRFCATKLLVLEMPVTKHSS